MTKIGKQLIFSSFWLFIGLLLVPVPAVTAQNFSLDATVSANQVFIGEQFTLTIEIQGNSLRNVELPVLPELTGIRILSSSPSRGQSISIINGRTTTSTTYRYTLIAREEGAYQIPPISITIDGEEYQTTPISVEVLQNNALQSDSAARLPDIFAEIQLDRDSPIIGQQLIASLVIYFKEGIEVTSYQPSPGWRTDGFWKEELENIQQPQAETEIFGNIRYRKATLLRYALFPSRSGTLTLSPFELQLGIRSQPRRNDPFGSVFGGFGTNQQRITVETETVDVTVNRIDPPQRGLSINAVGSFTIDRRASITQAYVGESIELITHVSGQGNIPLVDKPRFTFPESFETYQPQEESNLNRRGTTISGSKTFTDIVVPRTAGTFTIPENEIAYYNPTTGGYSYITLSAISIDVIRDPAVNLSESTGTVSLQPVTGLAVWSTPGAAGLSNKYWIWIGFLIPLVALFIGYRRKKYLDRLQDDSGFARSRFAWAQARKRIEEANEHVRNRQPKQVYHSLHKAVTGFISDRLSLSSAGIPDRDYLLHVEKQTDRIDVNRMLKQILDKCATISYAPVESEKDLVADIKKTEELLKQLRSILK